ncbi:hypothetical protein HDE_01557 [Halotydeus destructor]|nr:hypothetical protein HDE_01557 [Halotydeus destructor]
MLIVIIITALTLPFTLSQNHLCGSDGASGPDNAFVTSQHPSADRQKIAVEKNGTVAHHWSGRGLVVNLNPTHMVKTDEPMGIFSGKEANTFVLYSTSGATTCPYLLIGDQVECDRVSARFLGLTDFAKGKNISRISGTELPSGMFLFSIHTYDQFSSMSYHQILLNQNGWMIHSRPILQESATALTSFSVKKETLLVFFGSIAGIYQYDSAMNTALSVSRNVNYQSSQRWLDCEPDYCFDGSIDGATEMHNQLGVEVYQGKYSIVFSKANQQTQFQKGAIDSIEKLSNSYLTSIGPMCDIIKAKFICTDTFHNLSVISSEGTIGASFYLQKTSDLYLISDNQHVRYMELNNTFSYLENGLLADLWPGLPQEIDGAASIGDSVIFIVDHFVFAVKASSMRQRDSIITTSLIQEYFSSSNCTDKYYKSSDSSRKLNISTFKEFKEYRMQFFPKIKLSTKLPTSLPSSTSSTSRQAHNRSSVNNVLIFFTIGSVVFIAVAFICAKLIKICNKWEMSERPLDNDISVTAASAVASNIDPIGVP